MKDKPIKWVFIGLILFAAQPAFAIYPAPVKSNSGIVVTEHYLASDVGAKILAQGGNAIDASVAIGYALAVVYPCCGNLGGGGFILLHLANGKDVFLDFRETAPLAAKQAMFLDKNGHVVPELSTKGSLAAAIPGTVLGLETVLKKYGTMTRRQVMAPAIQLAEQGFKLKSEDIKELQLGLNKFSLEKNTEIFRKNYQPGDKLIQKNLADTLRIISKQGADVFYQGSIAKRIVEDNNEHGGIFSLNDFSRYSVKERTPIYCSYRHYQIISAPPPSSGGIALCEALNILEGYPLQNFGFHSAQGSHYIIEAMSYTFQDRNKNLGDPDFVNNPVQQLISKSYAAQLRKKITPADNLKETHTTHYSVVDKFGNAAAVTYTLNSWFGSGTVAGDTGILMNDEMDDFSAKPGEPNQFGLVQGDANSIQPGKRPLSSMTPTIVLADNKLFMVLGSPGGPRIITSVLQTILNVIDYGMDIQAAVDSPRFHFQYLPAKVFMEPFTFSADTLQKLMRLGHQFEIQPPWSSVEAVMIDHGQLYGGTDHRHMLGKAAAGFTS